MKLSTKGRYGLMAMHYLAENAREYPVPLRQIALDEGLSEAYLEQLFSLLKKKDLVVSVRGPQGGYSLGRDPEEISIGEIILALEGELKLSCCQEKKAHACDKKGECATKDILDTLRKGIESVMDSVSLADM